jgi:hypothetical protein
MDLTLDIDLLSHRTAAAISESLRVAHIGSNRTILGGHHDYIRCESLAHRVIAEGSTMTLLSRRTFLAAALASGILT